MDKNFYLNIVAAAFLRRAEVEDLRDLTSRRVRPVEAERARRESEGRAVRTLHRRSTSVAVARSAAVVAKAETVLGMWTNRN